MAADLVLMRSVINSLFPWLQHIGQTAAKALQIKSDSTLVTIAGDDDAPEAARLGDFVARFYRDSVSGILYVSLSPSAPYSWSAVASGIIPPTTADAGTPIAISEGSSKVRIG